MELLINIDVDDLARGIDFYAQGLGLRLGRKLFDGAVAEMLGGNAPIYLLAKPAGTRPTTRGATRRDYRRHWTPVHLDFVVADLEQAIERALDAGAEIEDWPQEFAWGRQATLSDPFGHGLCFIEWKGRGYATVAD
ncbi:VOC family protein [Cupriavidus taiwanensis]|uniref:Putative Glyoxalase/bleomycin resistance protein/dioxygenase n=1 Tax=Cupriavidus taiwanensis TaxID=164546 RepID=A0A375ID98_9BURK|nr:VOC family protein [Cupriavidus taiwanensis]SOY43148.1 putative Glyoxalase/bleomycin resistance protein/dioxygenase [Cupriavidus taiwanensis]SOY45630.1 putative Glyoxalase/bleomycin resistance protein/dioxygenase [Cupriavidus taiwanensis]SOY81075.1 putative Glyoxalase/bleomycin resistance protein/dioxygenase [Cupriavidus taiwanensis]SOZ21918.1 putative Glyoxalase/bleomycin resistance protein/dioxygenase [Cupriavidus taiwanensis]SOZ53333.1 putative Glyoxalase/bleomycin resistance protein/dio